MVSTGAGQKMAAQYGSKNLASVGMLAVAGALVASAVPAQAQGQVSPPTRDELVPPEFRDTRRPSVTLTVDGEMQRSPCALDDPNYSDIKLTLSSVAFGGAEKAPDVSLAPAYESYIGRELPISVLCDIRAQANRILQNAGYLATVEIPEQRLRDGAAEFRIVFGRLTALRVRGEAGPSEALVASYLEKLTEQEVFNSNEAERYLLLADDLPGVDVRLSLRPAANGDPGDLIGEIAVIRQRGVLDFSVQNYGSKALGRMGGLLRGELYDLTGLGDTTSASVFLTADPSEQQTVQLGHEFRVGSEGLRLGTSVTLSWTNPDVALPGFDVESDTLLASVYASYPLKRTRASSLWLGGGFDLVDQDVDVNGFALTRDRVRTAYASLSYDSIDRASVLRQGGYSEFEPKTRFAARLEVRQGLDVLRSSPDCRTNPLGCFAGPGGGGRAGPPSRIEADPTPLFARLDTLFEYRPQTKLTFALRANAQLSGDPLPAFEEFSGGNYSIGRGYDPGAVLGDSGLGLSAEVRYGSIAPDNPKAIAVQPYLFTDAVWAWNEDPSRRPLNPDRLWSAGGGVRVAYGAAMLGDLTIAIPLERPDLRPTRGDVRVLFSLTARLLPWRF